MPGGSARPRPWHGHDYSNLSSHLLATIVSRACEQDLLDFATEHLFEALETTPEEWKVDWEGYRYGSWRSTSPSR
jgi:CubicO group peptidase (beta-lactamase class C family)